MKLTLTNRFSLRWSMLLTIALGVALLVLAFRGIDWNAMLDTIHHGRLDYLLLSFLILTLSYLLRGLRWRVLLSAEKPIPVLDVFWATSVGYLGNSFLPARAGELIRSVLIGQSAKISTSYVLATALTERVLDVAALVIFSLLSLPQVGALPASLVSASQALVVLSAVGLAVFFVAPRLQPLILSTLRRLPLPEPLLSKLIHIAEQFLLGMRAFQQISRAVGFAVLTVVIWLVDVGVAILVATAFGLSLSVPQAFLLLSALGLSSAIPSTPGYIGIYQFVAVTVLIPFGFAQNQALVFIVAFQMITYAVVIVWGGLGLWQLSALKRMRIADPHPHEVETAG